MESNSVSPLPPPEAPLAMMENGKTPPRSPSSEQHMPPPEAEDKLVFNICSVCMTSGKYIDPI